MNTVLSAFSMAATVWEPALLAQRGFHAALALVHLVAAGLCFVNGCRERKTNRFGALWLVCASVLCILAVNTALQADVLVTQFVRSLAKLQAWYGNRRLWQYGALCLLGLVFFMVTKRLRPRFGDDQAPSGLVALGMSALVALLLTRVISAHATDAVINQRMLGISAGRLLELAAISMVLFGSLRQMRLR